MTEAKLKSRIWFCVAVAAILSAVCALVLLLYGIWGLTHFRVG